MLLITICSFVADDKSLPFEQLCLLKHHCHHHHQYVFRKSVPSATTRAPTNVGHAPASRACTGGLANVTGPKHQTAITKAPANSGLCFHFYLLLLNISCL